MSGCYLGGTAACGAAECCIDCTTKTPLLTKAGQANWAPRISSQLCGHQESRLPSGCRLPYTTPVDCIYTDRRGRGHTRKRKRRMCRDCPSDHLTPLRRCSVNILPSALNSHDSARPGSSPEASNFHRMSGA